MILESSPGMAASPDWNWCSSLGDGKTASKVINIIQGKTERRKFSL